MTDPKTSYSDLMSAVDDLQKKAIDRQLVLDVSDWAVQNAGNYPHDSDLDDFMKDKDSYETTRKGELESHFSDLPDFVQPYSELPEPSSFSTMASTLEGALGQLVVGPGGHADFVANGSIPPNAAYDGFTSIDGLIPTWAGVAAQTFKTQFAPKIPAVVWNEFSVVEGLRGAMLGAETMYDEARKDICKLVDAALAAVEAKSGGGDMSASAALGLLGALIGVVAIPFTGGLSSGVTAAAFTITTSALAVAGAGASIAESSTAVSGADPIDIVDDFKLKLGQVNSSLRSQERELQDSLEVIDDNASGVTRRRVGRAGPDPEDVIEQTTPNQELRDSYTMPRPALADVTQDNVTDDGNVGRPG